MTGKALPADYLAYPHRREGLDHDLFDRRYLRDAAPARWPGGAPLAVWVTIDLQHFPMDMTERPFVPTGGMVRPYPSYWDYTQRDYGNRVGVFRILRALDAAGVTPDVAANAAVLERYPPLAEALLSRGCGIVASGLDMGHMQHGGLDAGEEAALIARSLGIVRGVTGRTPSGWHTPAGSASAATHDLLAAAGIGYVTGWTNDEMPYPIRTRNGPLVCLPRSHELRDATMMVEHRQPVQAWADQVRAACRMLLSEARPEAGRILSLSLTPWVTGQPYAIAALEALLADLRAEPGLWWASGEAILGAWHAGGA